MTDLRFGFKQVPEWGEQLGLSETVIERAQKRCERIEKETTINRSPSALAAGSIYLTALLNNQKVTQQEVSEVVGVNKQTLREAYHDIAVEEGFSDAEWTRESKTEPDGLLARLKAWVQG